MEGGAYSLGGQVYILSSLQMWRTYGFPNVKAFARLYKTNNASAERHGVQDRHVELRAESAVDLMARQLGMDPWEFSLQDTLEVGGTCHR